MVLHLGQIAQYWLSSLWLGSSLADRNLGVLVGNELSRSQQRTAAVTKANQTVEHC